MKSMRLLFVLFVICLISGCVTDNPNGPFDISFQHDSGVVVPAEGGWYYFTVEAIKTKAFDWVDVLGYVEYKVHIDNTIIKESYCSVETFCEYINEGDTFPVWFDIPENTSTYARELIVKANVLSQEEFWDKSFVIGDDALWEIVWQGTQLAP